jgi:hypothetical protein
MYDKVYVKKELEKENDCFWLSGIWFSWSQWLAHMQHFYIILSYIVSYLLFISVRGEGI